MSCTSKTYFRKASTKGCRHCLHNKLHVQVQIPQNENNLCSLRGGNTKPRCEFSLVSISVLEIGRVVVSNAFLSQQWGIWRDNSRHRHSNWRVELRYVMKLKAYLWLPVRFSVQKLLRNQKWKILARNYKVTLTMFSQAFKLKMIIRFLSFFCDSNKRNRIY